MAKYIGEDMVYADPISAKSIVLENGKEYDAQFQYDCVPQVIINSQVVQPPGATVWAILENGQINIPFAPDLISNFWEE